MRIHLLSTLLLWAGAWLLPACGGTSPAGQPARLEGAALAGQRLAARHCSGCHALPEPAALDKQTWRRHVLPKMALFLGVDDFEGGPLPDERNARNAHLFPEQPRLSRTEWERLVRYFVQAAPDHLPEPHTRPFIRPGGVPQFIPRLTAGPVRFPVTSLVRIDEANGKIYFGDGITRQLYRLSIPGGRLDSLYAGSAPAHLRITPTGLNLLTMGVMNPSDARAGRLQSFPVQPGGPAGAVPLRILDSLARPVHVSYADLNGDGKEDVVASEFGNYVGQLAWYENDSPRYRQHLLRSRPGATATVTGDFTRDGRPDVLALMAQGDEGVFLYENGGAGRFREKRLLTFPPSYGANFLDTVELNGDAAPDLLVTNGDNGDYPPIVKPYHGIRLYRNDGRNCFKEVFFFPMHGVSKAIMRDFDADGDPDIAAIAYFPDYVRAPQESFVYLQNQGNLTFSAHSFPQATTGRWMVMDAGDVDRDGDVDIVLGCALLSVGAPPEQYRQRWQAGTPSVLILENTRRSPAPTATAMRGLN